MVLDRLALDTLRFGAGSVVSNEANRAASVSIPGKGAMLSQCLLHVKEGTRSSGIWFD